MPRINLIHATPLAIDPVVDTFKSDWAAAEIASLLDDSLAPDLEKTGRIDDAMFARFRTLSLYSKDAGADAILFTCSAFGAAIEAVAKELAPMPVLKPNEAMFEDAISAGGTVGLVATFGPSVPSMRREFEDMAKAAGATTKLVDACTTEALAALKAGDGDTHDKLIAEAAKSLADADVIMLAQFSMARAKPAVEKMTGKTVLTSPISAVNKLKRVLGAS